MFPSRWCSTQQKTHNARVHNSFSPDVETHDEQIKRNKWLYSSRAVWSPQEPSTWKIVIVSWQPVLQHGDSRSCINWLVIVSYKWIKTHWSLWLEMWIKGSWGREEGGGLGVARGGKTGARREARPGHSAQTLKLWRNTFTKIWGALGNFSNSTFLWAQNNFRSFAQFFDKICLFHPLISQILFCTAGKPRSIFVHECDGDVAKWRKIERWQTRSKTRPILQDFVSAPSPPFPLLHKTQSKQETQLQKKKCRQSPVKRDCTCAERLKQNQFPTQARGHFLLFPTSPLVIWCHTNGRSNLRLCASFQLLSHVKF